MKTMIFHIFTRNNKTVNRYTALRQSTRAKCMFFTD